MLKITNYGDRAEIYITGIVIDDTDANWLSREDGKIVGYTYPADIKAQLDSLRGLPIDVHIASDGGDVGAGIAIYNMLAGHDAPVVAYIDKWAASIASYIAMAASKIVMPSNTYMMIHNPQAGTFGDAKELRNTADWLEQLQDMLVRAYSNGENEATVREMMDKETWLTATECSELFGDKVEVVEPTELKAVACYSGLKTAPEALRGTTTPTPEQNDATDENRGTREDILNILRRSWSYEEKG